MHGLCQNERMKLERSDAIANHQRVLDVACQIFNEQGVNADVKDIAAVAGVGVGTIYRGFGSKDGLIQAASQQAGAEFVRLLENALDPSQPLDAMRSFLLGVAAFIDARRGLLGIFMRSDSRYEVHDTYHRGLRRLLENGIRSGDFRKDVDIDVLVLLLAGAVTQLLGFRESGDNVRPTPEDFANGILAVFQG